MLKTRSGKTYSITQINMATANNLNAEELTFPPPLKDDANVQPDNISNKDLFASMQTITGLVQTLSAEVSKIRNDITPFNEATNQINGIKEQLYTTQGRLACLTKRHEELEDKLITYQIKEFEHDLVLYNLKEPENENQHTLKTVLYQFFNKVMQIPDNLIFGTQNAAGEIRIDTTVRQGRYVKDKSRPVIISFVTKTGRNIVYSKAYTKHLVTPTKERIAEHFPAIVKERRQAQIDTLINLRKMPQNKNSVISLRRDKIYIDKKETSSDLFMRNPVSSITPLSIRYDKLEHSETYTHKDSTFQAHALQVKSKEHVAAAINSIYQNPLLATADHIMYAYKFGVAGESVESGFSDDKEIQGGHTLMDILNKKKITNIVICVTRLKKGSNIGKMRFELIQKCVNELLSKNEEKEDPTFNQVLFS